MAFAPSFVDGRASTMKALTRRLPGIQSAAIYDADDERDTRAS